MARKQAIRAAARDPRVTASVSNQPSDGNQPTPSIPQQRVAIGESLAHKSKEFLSQDARVAEIFQLITLVADTNATVLITGETGTGKELIAREIAIRNRRRTGSIVTLNCAAIPESLQESELFGHVDGAFTGATKRMIGRFEAADGGTIFLDEISEMNKLLQAKLLRVLQSGEYTPLGSSASRYCDVRVIAATNRSLDRMVATHEFRADLYYRLNIICLEIPPLRDRRADIPLLAKHFAHQFCRTFGKPPLSLSEESIGLFMKHSFPGNVRELENVIMRAVLLCQGDCIGIEHLPDQLRKPTELPEAAVPTGFHEAKARAVERFEQEFLIAALSASGGLVNRAARNVGLSERNFHAKLKKYRVSSRKFRAG